jgi:hypothetical protein
MKQKKLVRSALLVAVGSVLPAAAANATLVVYTDYTAFSTDAGALGYYQEWVETFEENTLTGAYAMLTSPLQGGVPNGVFTNGLDVMDLTMSSLNGGSLFLNNAYSQGGYYPHMTSDNVGTLEYDASAFTFGGAAKYAVGMDVMGVSNFISGYFDELNYTVYDGAGGVLGSGSLAADGSVVGFLGFVSTDAIGSVEIAGTAFGALEVQEYFDNVEAWAVPAPGALSLLGLAGSRRRRG